jgi:DNA-binding CsgD family transcriptional regulator/tetratricopeptide (TPR) repeat protein
VPEPTAPPIAGETPVTGNWNSLGDPGLSLPDGMLEGVSPRLSSTVLVGRDEQLADLDTALNRARDGSPVTVLLGGEAGIGKSRLVNEFVATARGTNTLVLRGGCLDLGADGLPFAPFSAMLRELVRDLGADHVAGLLPGHAARDLARLLPEFGAVDREADPVVARARLFEQVLTLLERLAEDAVVALIIEDAHWADRSTRDLLAFLVSSQQVLGTVMIIVTYRSDELHRSHPLRPLLAELDRLGWVERAELPRLSRMHADELVAQITGSEPAGWLADEVYRRTEGNPLFVEELLCCDGGLSAELPESLRDLLLVAARRLPEDTQELLRAASAGGQRTSHALLASVTARSGDDLARGLRPAVSANVLTTDGDGYAFRHALIREAVYDDLLPGERTRLHTRFAEVLSADPGMVPAGRAAIEQAHHWYHAHDTTAALESAWRAAAEAEHAVAHAEQLTLLVRVLELWEKVPDASLRIGASHLSVLEQAAIAAEAANNYERGLAFASAAVEEVDADAEPPRAALLLETRAKLSAHLGHEGATADLRTALELVPPGTADDVRAKVLVSAIKHVPGLSVAAMRDLATEARALARAAGDAATEATALGELALFESNSGNDAAALEMFAEAREIAVRNGVHRQLMVIAINESHVLEGLGEHEQAAQVARAGIAQAGTYGLARSTGTFLAINVAEPLQALGQWDEAAEVVEHALALSPPQLHRAALRIVGGDIALRRGDLVGAATSLAIASAALDRAGYRGHHQSQYWLPLAQLEAELLLAQDKPADAVGALAAAVDRHDLLLAPRYAWSLLAAGARACVAAMNEAGRVAQQPTEALLGRLREVALKMDAAGPVQQAHRLTFVAESGAELDRGPGEEPTATSAAAVAAAAGSRQDAGQALARWDLAAEAWERVAQPYQLAVALSQAARAATAAGDREGGAARLRRAAELAGQLGALPLREQVGTLARAARITLGKPGDWAGAAPTPPRLGLTAREFEVLRHVAAGQSNPEIAANLFISAKTASVHVSNILAKLGVASRGEAAAAAHRLGLFDLQPTS